MAREIKERGTRVPTMENPFGLGNFNDTHAFIDYGDEEYTPFAHRDIPTTKKRAQTATEINMEKAIQKDKMIDDMLKANLQRNPFGEAFVPVSLQNTNATGFTQKLMLPTFDEMLVALFESEPALIEKLSLIADEEKVSTIDIIIYILNDYLTPTEHK